MDYTSQKRLAIHFVASSDSPEFARLSSAITRSWVVALDAEWKPVRTPQHTLSFPRVCLLQLAFRLGPQRGADSEADGDSVVFLIDLLAVSLPPFHELLTDLFTSPDVLKLGFKFKQDLIYLSSTFCDEGCDPGFDRVEPYIDVTSVYNLMRHKQLGRQIPRHSKSLAAICYEVLGISLSKELQCSDWSFRPLTEEQKLYAAADAYCLLDIFSVFHVEVEGEVIPMNKATNLRLSNVDLGLKEILRELDNIPNNVLGNKFSLDSNIGHDTILTSNSLLKLVRRYGDKILLKESDKKPKTSKKKDKRSSSAGLPHEKQLPNLDDWQGPPPWDLSLGGDGSPKFLCDVMVEGLAKHLRCVGVDAAIPYSRKPQPRELLNQAQKEKRVLLTRDSKLLRHNYLIQNQICLVKSSLKNAQLLEVIEIFQLKISEDQLMSRCTKCNGKFVQKPLTTEEAVEAGKGFQIIPKCLFEKNLEFWKCMDCNQLYWEGTQYHNAVQKFIDVCKLGE